MATYAGVTFDIEWRGVEQPAWQVEQRHSRRPLPYAAGGEDVQLLGSGLPTLVLPVLLADSADLATLRAARDGTARVLGDVDGTDYGSTVLLAVRNARQLGTRYLAELEFVQT